MAERQTLSDEATDQEAEADVSQSSGTLPFVAGDRDDDARSVASHVSHTSVRSVIRRKERELKMAARIKILEEQRKAVQAEAERERKIREAEAERERKMREADAEQQRKLADMVAEQEKMIIEMKLQKELEDLADEEEDLLEEMGLLEPTKPLISRPVIQQRNTQDWVNAVPADPPSPVPSRNPSNHSNRASSPPTSIRVSEQKSEIVQVGEVIAAALGKALEQMKPVVTPSTSEKVLARKAYGADLPQFNGRPEEWMIFHTTYTQSSQKCEFSDYENLHRLRRCLKGEAYKEIECLLDDPENVPRILTVLENKFGRKKHIINYHLSKLQTVPNMKENDLVSVMNFGRYVRNLVETLKGFKSQVYLENPQLLDGLITKLPVSMKEKWMKTHDDDTTSLIVFEEWIRKKVDIAERLVAPNVKQEKTRAEKQTTRSVFTTETSSPPQPATKTATETSAQQQSSTPKPVRCQHCQTDGHRIQACDQFKKGSIEARLKTVKDRKLCYGCLNFGHGTKDCRTKKKCTVGDCSYFHHSLLHRPATTAAATTAATATNHVVPLQLHVSTQITYQVLPVTLRGPKGEISTYALLDPGSAYTLLDEELASQLQLPGKKQPLGFSTISNSQGSEIHSRVVSLTIVNPSSGETFKMTDVRTFPSLTLRGGTVSPSQLKQWKHLDELPLPLYSDVHPKILIGLPHHELITPTEVVRGCQNGPAAGKTPLGWMVYGRMALPEECKSVTYVNGIYTVTDPDPLYQLVKSYFSTEEFGVRPTSSSPYTKDEQKAEEIAMRTLRRVGHRYEIGLLWKDETVTLPESKTMALQRLSSIERKLDKDPVYAKKYCDNIQHYVDSGYLQKMSQEEAEKATTRTWFLPHFGVSKASKPEKLRLVFDAAATSHGVSLNSALYSGPDILKPLPSVLCKFRERRVAITADIKEMFHQVQMKEDDQFSQRILWRGMDRDRPPDQYKMKVMTFGATCSPYCAQLVKRENAMQFATKFPRAVDAIVSRHYVDDLLDSCDTTAKAFIHFQEVFKIQKHGGFHLCNWASNDPNFIQQIPEDLRSKSQKSFGTKDTIASERILGLEWNPAEDFFTFSTSFFKVRKEILNGEESPTKREALSVVMSVFDPLGFAAVLTVKAKILLQLAWRAGIGWDDILPESLWNKWKEWIADLQGISFFKIPRCYSLQFSKAEEVQLHVFCDASELAYSAVAYFRIESGETAFVAAKTRVTPLKAITIPRYELQAALMGARLAHSVKEWHSVQPTKCFFWTDSRTVMCWLSMDSCRLKQFVSNRVGEILDLTQRTDWHWISTHDNVADEATRDRDPCDFSTDSRWLNGPSFLKLSPDQWPIGQPSELKEDPEILEIKKEFCGHVAAAKTIVGECPFDISRFSSWTRLIRSTGYLLRAVRYGFRGGSHPYPPFAITELAESETFWWRWAQAESYPELVTAFRIKDQIRAAKLQRHTPLRGLSLFMDDTGVLRIKGRVQAEVAIGNLERNPVVLHPKHPYTILMIRHYHEKAGHQNQATVINDIKQKYCITALREAVKKLWSNCQRCRNDRARPMPPEMAPLPLARLDSYQRPFTRTGVDYFGPMEVTIGRRHEKRYGALFTCLVTRAVHLELAGSLSTDSFIMALRRFIARRGNPAHLYSDNGTNFVGANTELKKAIGELDQEKIREEMNVRSIEWHFNPPYAPHMGGSWERMVQSVKRALHAVLKERTPREETLLTFLTEAENTVNGHPLVYVDSDVETEEVLTPNHFLIGTPNSYQPPGKFDDGDLIPGKQWRLAMRLADHFWGRWIREFLPTLTNRQKWIEKTVPIKVGDVVLVVDDSLPRNCWPKGVVEEVPETKDGQVRWAMVKTAAGHYKRPATRLCVLKVK